MGKQYAGIVRIENAAIQPDYRTPWNGARPTGGSGTGFLIGNNLPDQRPCGQQCLAAHHQTGR